jgi:hypothetical protein
MDAVSVLPVVSSMLVFTTGTGPFLLWNPRSEAIKISATKSTRPAEMKNINLAVFLDEGLDE